MGRRLLPLLLAAAFAGAGAQPAAAQECATTPVLCVGQGKVTERAEAECRRGGACPARDLSSYGSSWIHRAHVAQRALGDDLPLANAPWVGTHNSFNAPVYAPTLSRTDSNQQLSLTDQLAIDVRSLELDVHWILGRAVVCHGRDANEAHAGCTTEEPLGTPLAEIAAWLDAHPKEVLLLYVEDDLGTDPAAYDATAAELERVLGPKLFRPRPSGEGCAPLPTTPTRRDVRAAGAQVVVVSGCGPSAGWRGAVFDWDGGPTAHVESGASSAYDDRCDPERFSRATYESRLVRYFEDSTWVSTVVSGPSTGITPAVAASMARCGVDLVGLDQLLPDDGRLEALVWSFAPGEPGAGACTIQRADGRWADAGCRARRPAACRTATGWALSAPVTAAGAGSACRRAGGRFAVPRTGRENAVLHAAAGRETWLAR